MKDTQIKLNESPKILMLIVKSMLDGQNYFSGRSKKKKISKQINKKNFNYFNNIRHRKRTPEYGKKSR